MYCNSEGQGYISTTIIYGLTIIKIIYATVFKVDSLLTIFDPKIIVYIILI